MRNLVTASIVTLAAGWMLAGSTTGASAHRLYHGCGSCGPVAPSTYYKTIHPAKFTTRYHDVSVYKHVHRIHRIVNVTRVQPIIHIHNVTRVHHHTIVETRNAYEHVTRHLTPIRYVTHSTQNFYDCGCGR